MFSRYALHSTLPEIEQTFSVVTNRSSFSSPRYNIAPGSIVPIIVAGTARDVTLVDAMWDGVAGSHPSSTIASLRAHQSEALKLLSRNRCLLPVNGFYEWKRLSERIQLPFYFRLLKRDVFGIAGIYSRLEDADGKLLYHFAALEVTSNELLEPLSESMPAILDENDAADWLNPLNAAVASAEALLKSCKTNLMASYRVGDEVNSLTADGDGLIKPVV